MLGDEFGGHLERQTEMVNVPQSLVWTVSGGWGGESGGNPEVEMFIFCDWPSFILFLFVCASMLLSLSQQQCCILLYCEHRRADGHF